MRPRDRRAALSRTETLFRARRLGPVVAADATRGPTAGSFLPAFEATAAALAHDKLMAEHERLYMHALDNLARAEAGTLERIVFIEDDTGQRVVKHRPKVSITAVARAIREARSSLVALQQLSATQKDSEGLPRNVDSELADAIRKQLAIVVSRRALDPPIVDAEVVNDDDLGQGAGSALGRPEVAKLTATAADRQPSDLGGQAGRAGADPTCPRARATPKRFFDACLGKRLSIRTFGLVSGLQVPR